MAQSYPHLFSVFARFGPLHEVQLQQLSGNDYRLGQPSASAYAFVQYYSVGDTQAALQACRQRRVHVHHHAVIASPVGRRAVRWTDIRSLGIYQRAHLRTWLVSLATVPAQSTACILARLPEL